MATCSTSGYKTMLHTFLLIVCELQWLRGYSLNSVFEFVGKQFESNLGLKLIMLLKLIRLVFEFVAINLMYFNFQFPW